MTRAKASSPVLGMLWYLRVGNCHVRRLTEAFCTEGRRGPSFKVITIPSHLLHTQHPFLLLCLAITESLSCDRPPRQSSTHRLASGAAAGEKPLPPPLYLVTSPFGGPQGTLLSSCTPVVFSRTCREPHPIWNRMYPSLPVPCFL